jgi:hypothetical protein
MKINRSLKCLIVAKDFRGQVEENLLEMQVGVF